MSDRIEPDTIAPDVPLYGQASEYRRQSPEPPLLQSQPRATPGLTSQSPAPERGAIATIYHKLKDSSHPIALIFFLGFRVGALATYCFGLFFTSSFVFMFITTILLLAADFWTTKNIAGRLLVGLRWWNESSSDGKSTWVFETADPARVINPIDSKVFWMFVYGAPAFWVILALLAILKLQFLSLILVIIAGVLSTTNAVAFSRCDKFSKANGVVGNLTGSLLSRAVGGGLNGMFSRLSPFRG
ncbi:DUF846-domain-containing protein [Nadsonia fulvescens var. elongata DSM 6958]|uniref:Golgi apparatus membrane protein TVP23 n=1 Tax=Nadsonia fulvescens var. elongata DSM 6958 TaxID=857566 RepID=A0A1E3PH45_9ASCO|nr:DUF846-domain-containing protein [Nadsonia fulvescens var. elongata DSM 6958]